MFNSLRKFFQPEQKHTTTPQEQFIECRGYSFDADALIDKIANAYEGQLADLAIEVAKENKHNYVTTSDVLIALVRSDAERAYKERIAC